MTADYDRLLNFVRELTEVYPDPDSGIGRAGLMYQAWSADPLILTTKQPQASDGGHTGKPGSRPPCRLDLWAHVQSCLDVSRELADDLGARLPQGEGWEALLRLPALIMAFDPEDVPRKRTVKRIGQQHSTLRTALGWQEPRADWPDVQCPECHRFKVISARVQQQRVWCRNDECEFHREGALAILAMAA